MKTERFVRVVFTYSSKLLPYLKARTHEVRMATLRKLFIPVLVLVLLYIFFCHRQKYLDYRYNTATRAHKAAIYCSSNSSGSVGRLAKQPPVHGGQTITTLIQINNITEITSYSQWQAALLIIPLLHGNSSLTQLTPLLAIYISGN